jgi:enoyl-[acyl-carrier-protein] reductase (NADH)
VGLFKKNADMSQRQTCLFAKADADVAIDIAGPILFLASDLARHITGEVVNVNGGSVMCA